jgi:hypothetical protein
MTQLTDTRTTSRRWARSIVALLALCCLVGVVGVAAPARAGDQTLEKLVAQGWTCVPFLPAHRYSCFNPGLGRPFPGNPDPRPTYSFLGFDLTSGEFLYTGHLIRGDLYAGQPCAPGNDLYAFRALIGYYECVHA